MKGRVLIDLPAHGLMCGEYADLPKAAAGPLIKAGHFDPKAVQGTDAGVDSGAGADTAGGADDSGASGQVSGGEGDPATAVGGQTGPEA